MSKIANTQVYRAIAECCITFSEEPNLDQNSRDFGNDIETNAIRISRLIDFIKPLRPLGQKFKVLEVGIGYAYVTTALRTSYKPSDMEIHAIEHPDRHFPRNKKFKEHLSATGVKLALCNIGKDTLPYESESFDIVIFSETLEHLPPTRLPEVLAEISRVLQPGGHLIASAPNLGGLKVRWKMMRGKTPFDEAIPITHLGGDTYGHIRLYTIDEIRKLCERFGLRFQKIKFGNYGTIGQYTYIQVMTRILSRVFPKVSHDFMFCARKGQGS